ncbi:diguanylate cyclase [Shewanella avicenniae]|uniref:diguanylate cyclase n=2 Tax=Shewanella avicenniae TaxID=2814294 RepID=A0ABX7QXL4_9GAMM|nr:diguanylate cyclase [Shewanella avicenniae]
MLFSQFANAFEVSNGKSVDIDLTPYVLVTDQASNMSLKAVQALSSQQWQPQQDQLQLQLGAKGRWLYVKLTQAGSGKTDRFLELANPNVDQVRLYHTVNGELVQQLVLGDTLPFSKRPQAHANFLVPFEMQQGEQHEFWLALSTEGSSYLPLHLWSSTELLKREQSREIIKGFQLGILCAIGLFSLCMALITGSYTYGYYAGYVLFMALLVSCINGTGFQYLWPNYPLWQQKVLTVVIPLVVAFGALFTEKTLLLKYFSVPMLRICRALTAFCLLLAVVSFGFSQHVALIIELIVAVLICLTLAVMTVMQAISGNKLAQLYAFSSLGIIIGSLLTCFQYIGFIALPVNPQTPIMIGLTIEIVLKAIVLVIRYNDERKAKTRIQQEALEQAERIRKVREDALQMEAATNERLERMVQERTLELEFTLRELNEANQKLIEQAQVDSLTGVRNRASFEKRLQAEGRISRRQQTPLALMMLDIDHFKVINDTYGHLAGDDILKQVAFNLRENLKRPSDLVCRFGGEEFAIILPNTDAEGALVLAEMLRETIAQLEITWDNARVPLTVSIGVSAAIVASDDHIKRLLSEADKALYQAKGAGRNRVWAHQVSTDNPLS